MKEKVPDEVFEELLKELENLKEHILDFGKSWGTYANETDLTDKQMEKMEEAADEFEESLAQMLDELSN
jgi:Spy/CpxP family protein refolding chaperone